MLPGVDSALFTPIKHILQLYIMANHAIFGALLKSSRTHLAPKPPFAPVAVVLNRKCRTLATQKCKLK
jgi:hypothetical protein